MAEEAISTAILTVATIIAALVLVNALYPSLYSTSGSILSMNDRTADRIRTDLTVLTEWYDRRPPGGRHRAGGLDQEHREHDHHGERPG